MKIKAINDASLAYLALLQVFFPFFFVIEPSNRTEPSNRANVKTGPYYKVDFFFS